MTASKIVTVASAVPGEGKSTFACNFALAAADIGLRTLLIDGDIYTGKAGLVFGSRKAGLSEVLNEQISLRQALAKDPATGLSVLGARDPSRSVQPETMTPRGWNRYCASAATSSISWFSTCRRSCRSAA
jgi:Mrp family chromosome partitioning ATPase